MIQSTHVTGIDFTRKKTAPIRLELRHWWRHLIGGPDCRRTTRSPEYSLETFDQYREIFIHIPKTGGVSVAQALYGNLAGGHRGVAEYKDIFGPLTYRKYFVFAFVRHPLTRLMSAFAFLKKGGMNEQDRIWAEENITPYQNFGDFVRLWLTEQSIWTGTHFRPQHSFLCEAGSIPLVDYVGRFERLEEDFSELCAIRNRDVTLPKHNASGKASDGLLTLDEEVIDKVFEVYRRDFELFEYPKLPELTWGSVPLKRPSRMG